MTHSWKYYEAAKEITQKLHEMGLIKTWNVDKTRGVIQIILEERQPHCDESRMKKGCKDE